MRFVRATTEADMDDKALVARLLRGDERAFTEFFDSFFPPMYRFVLSRVDGAQEVAEDVVQSAMSKAVTKLHLFRGEALLLTWLLTFCRHELSAHWEKSNRERAVRVFPDDLREVEAALDSLAMTRGPADPEVIAARDETARLVQIVLDRLPRHYGDVLEWKYLDGSSVAEIAARLGVGAKAAESLLTRARNAFRDAFMTLSAASEGTAR